MLDTLCGTKPPKSWGFRVSYCMKPRNPQDFGGFVPHQILGKFSVSYHDMLSSSRGKAAAAEANEAAAAAEAVKQQQKQQ